MVIHMSGFRNEFNFFGCVNKSQKKYTLGGKVRLVVYLLTCFKYPKLVEFHTFVAYHTGYKILAVAQV